MIFYSYCVTTANIRNVYCSEGKELTRALEDLSRMSVDPTFALEFFTRKGEDNKLVGSVADPDPGSTAFLIPESGIRIRDRKNPDP